MEHRHVAKELFAFEENEDHEPVFLDIGNATFNDLINYCQMNLKFKNVHVTRYPSKVIIKSF